MSNVSKLITPDHVACDVVAQSKKRALEELSALITRGEEKLTSAEVFNSLIARERLGATGIGHGIAIPHGRLKNTEHPLCAFIKLKTGVDFDAIDREPVDLMFALLVPEESTEEHLQILSALAGMFSDEALRKRMREAKSPGELCSLVTDWQNAH